MTSSRMVVGCSDGNGGGGLNHCAIWFVSDARCAGTVMYRNVVTNCQLKQKVRFLFDIILRLHFKVLSLVCNMHVTSASCEQLPHLGFEVKDFFLMQLSCKQFEPGYIFNKLFLFLFWSLLCNCFSSFCQQKD